MGFRPPKGVRPPQLEGKRTGRPKGSKSFFKIWRDAIWGFEHRDEERANPPTPAASVWWSFARDYPDELADFLERYGWL
jgi:hypothetical protein